MKKALLVILLTTLSIYSYAQDGPGGVGAKDGTGVIKLWLDADSATVDVDDEVTAWTNMVSVTELNMAPTTANNPNFISSKFNGHAAVSFENVDDALGSASTMDYSYFPEDEATTFTIVQHDNLSQQASPYATLPYETNRFTSHMPWNGTIYHDLGQCCGAAARVQYTFDADWLTEGSIFASRTGGGYNKEALRNNVSLVTGNATTSTFNNPENYTFEIGQSSSNNFRGDISEFLMFNAAINDAQMVIVHNYLAAKYNLTITDDFYLFQASHGVDVIGIGQESTGEEHTESKSAGIFTIKEETAFVDGDYVFAGHDNASASSWTTSEQINGDTNLERIAREWRFDAENFSGDITISIDPTDLPAFNTDFSFYTLWIDDDGDFTSGAIQYPLTLNSGEYEASGISITDGMFVTIGAYKPEINFNQTAFAGSETTTPATFEINIDYAVDADVTVDYTVSGTCTEDLPAAATFTITAGNTSTTLVQAITSGDGFEADETIILTLTDGTQSHGVLGTSQISTYTVYDDGASATNMVQFDAPFSYSHKKTITIDKDMVSGSTDLTDFPMLIEISGSDFTTDLEPNTLSSGNDIRFTLKNSVEWLEHQIETYDAANDIYLAWVKIPILSASTNTELEMYYGKTGVSDPSSSTVFGSAWEAVYHLEDGSDDSDNFNTGSLNGDAAYTTDNTGFLGNGLTLDGNADYLEAPNDPTFVMLPADKITLSGWYKGTDATAGEIISRMNSSDNNKGYSLRILSGKLSFLLIDEFPGGNGQMIRVATTSSAATDGDWHYLTATYDGSSAASGVTIFIDGVATATDISQLNDNLVSSDTDPNIPFNIGRRYNSTGNWLDGLVDEVRVIRDELSSDWVKTEYNNMIDSTATFITLTAGEATSGFQITEATDTVNLTIALSSIDANDVTVSYSVSSGSATSGSDYTLTAGSAIITAGNLSTVITVDLSDDSVDEPDETFTVSLSGVTSTSDVSLGTDNEIEITLLDDDDGPVISATNATIYVNEGSGINEWSIDLSTASQQTVTIDYTVTAVSATSGDDYIFSDGTISFPIDSTSTQGTFNLIDDVELESVESFTIQLSNPSNATLDGVLDEITVFINDNDNFGIDGPGGVGDADGSGTLVMWMIADSVVADGSNALTSWPNQIDIPNLDLTPVGTAPTFEAGTVNGHARVSFADGVNDEVRSSNLSVSSFPYNEGSVFLVTTHDNQGQQSVIYGTRGLSTRFNSHMPWNGTAYFDIGVCCGPRVQFTYDNDWVGEASIFTNVINSTSGQVVHRNGVQVGSDGDIGTVTNHTSGTFGLGISSIDDFAGDIMEYIMYTSPVNETQRIITENYLAAKYLLVIDNDIYGFQANYSFSVAGIGQEDGGTDDYHTSAKSEFLTISNADDLDDGEYVLFGHDNLDVSAWTTTEVPSDLSNIQRVEREWITDVTGDPGTISIAFDVTNLPDLPAGYTDYVLLTDEDGIFTDDASIYPMTFVDDEYKASNVSIVSGTRFTIGVHIRSIEFIGNATQDFENNNNTISLSLSLASGSDVSIPYTITGSATSGVDYTIATSGSFTVSAGNTIEIIDLGIINESDEETDETIIVTLGTAPTGTEKGTNEIFTYTINDDDNDRSINFDHFAYSREVTINGSQVTGSHTDFPVMISFTNTDLRTTANSGYVENDNGYDIALYDSLNSTWIDHQIEYYEPTTGETVLWARIPSLIAGTDITLTMFYGNSAITFDQSSSSTWKSAYQGVWHMGEDDYDDGTANAINGIDQGADDAAGIIGRAAYFDGTSNVKISDISNLSFGVSDSYTISAWYKGTDAEATIAGLVDDNSSTGQGYDLYISSSNYIIGWQGDDTGTKNYIRGSAGGDINDDNWYHVVVTYDGTSGIAYRNGANAMGSQNSTLIGNLSPNVAFTIGSRSSGAAISRAIVGTIDEVRVLNEVLSPDWITTEYSNQNDPVSFVTISLTQDTNESLTIDEDIDEVTVSLRLDPVDDTQATTIDFSDAATGSGIISEDFTLSPSTVTIPTGDRFGTVTFNIINDLTDESDETIDVQISNPSGNTKLGTVSSQTYTVTDDDEGPAVGFSSLTTTANEGSSVVFLTVELGAVSGNDIMVDYVAADVEAVSGTDYIALSGTLTIDAGDLNKTISFQPIDDVAIESPETLTVTLSSPINATLDVGNDVHTITIADNDDLGFEGPGGVGDVSNVGGENLLKLWLIADSVVSSGGSVTSWNNIIQNISIDYDMVPVGTAPDVVDNAVNGHKEISFNNVSDALISEGSLTAASFPGNELSIFIVTESDNLSQDSYAYATDDSETGTPAPTNSISATIPNGSGQSVFDLSGTTSTFTYATGWAGNHSIYSHIVSSDTLLVYRNNSALTFTDPGANTLTEHPSFNFYLGKDGSEFFQGNIAEIIMFSRDVNLAQSNIINNYLAAKYDLTIVDDIYNFEVSHGNDVAGIGQFNETNAHVAARAGIVTISNADDLDDGEYVLFGHDNADISSWSTSEIPAAGILRTQREWRFDSTGNPGSITIALDIDLLPALPNGDEDYIVLVDTDGDFSDGATTLSTVLVDGQYKASGVDLNSGDYVTFAIVSRTIAFTVATATDQESVAKTVEVTLSLESSSSVTLDYDITGGTATGASSDYSLATTGTVTFIAGETSVDIDLGIINDALLESDETIEITLSNPPSGFSLGTSVYTYTIQDDDNGRKIHFDAASSTVNEDVGTVTLTIELEDIAFVDATNPTTAEISITGGDAESSPSPDFTFVAGTVTIPATETSVTFDLDIINDVLSESDETLEISLGSPTNANLGTNSVFTYTITDNDADVTVEFQDATTTIDEGGSIAAIVVELSATSGQDVEIDYAVTGGSATGGGTDFTLAIGTLIIDAGDQLNTINVALTDDGSEESAETIELTLSGEVGATLGSQSTHTITLIDNDATFGYYGPGGVGDAESNLLWLDATAVNGKGLTNITDGSNVTTWVDRSGNENDFTAIGTAPIFDEDAFNLKNTVIVSSSAQGFQAPAGFSNALSNYSFVSVMSQTSGDYLVETNTAATDEFRLSQGGNGLYSINDTDYLPNSSSSNDITTWIFNSENSPTSAEIFRDGTALLSDDNYEVMSISDNFALGSRNQDQTQATTDFAGNISEFIMYTNVINEAQRVIIENYLANKYDLTIANDFYSYEGTYGNDIIGIGQTNSEQHLQSMSDSLLMISGASDLNNDEYVFTGHDGGDDLTWTTSEVPSDDINIQRIAREWRLDLTGTPGTLIIKIDTTQLPAPSSGYDEYLIWTDEDGDFRSGATTYQVEYSEIFGFHVSDEVIVADGTFIAIGIGQPVVEFALAESDNDEGVTNQNIEVALNFTLGENVTIDYAATGGTAVGGNVDYLLASGTLTIAAGQTSANISLGIIDDIILESDETIEITLSTPSSNVALGSISEHTYTIHDNDNTISIQYATPLSETGDEAVNTYTVTVEIDVTDPINPTTIDLNPILTGNYAELGIDYTLSTTTVSIAATTSSTTFDITIIDDGNFETDETITLDLTNPVNAQIGTNDQFIYTITDNDTAPVASFVAASSAVSESAGTAQVEVTLDAISDNDVTVNYTVTATATSGTDYTLADGSLLISSGDLTENIQPIVVNDLVTESAETVTISLTTATNATVSGTIVHVLTILDDDQAGSTGPGGVGDDSNNVLWLRGDNFVSGTWSDISGNANHFTGAGPAVGGTGINSMPTVEFTGSQSLTIATALSSTTSDFDVFVVTESDVATDQVLFSNPDGMIFGLEHASGGFQDQDNVWKGDEIVTGAATPAIIQYNLESGSGLAAISVDGSLETITTPYDYTATTISGTSTLGAGSGGFDGEMGEMIVYNGILNDAQSIIVNNYLSTRYGMTIANDFFAYDDGTAGNEYQFDLIGIGQVDSDNIHVTATAENFLTISNPNDLGDGEYMMIAHDDAGGAALDWADSNTPNAAIQRSNQEWRVDMTGNLGEISFQIDTTALPAPPTDGLTWALLVESADGDFTNGDTQIYPLSFVSGDIMGLNAITLADGDYFTIAVVTYEATTTGLFSTPGTWSTGVVPTTGVSVTIGTGVTVDLDVDAVIGSLTIETGGILDMMGNTLEFSDGCITLNGTGTVDINTTGSTIGYANPNAIEQCITEMTYNNLYTDGPSGSTKYLLGDIIVLGDINMQSSAGIAALFETRDVIGSGLDYDISMAGDWSSEITFAPRTGTVIFNGTADQQVDNSAAGGEHFNNLTINNTGGNINMASDINSAGILNMTNGNLVLGANNLNIENNASASITGGDASSYLVVTSSGLLRQTVALTTAYDFPVGDAVFYSPFTFVLNSGTLGSSPSITLNLRDDTYAGITEASYISRYWTLEETDITGVFGYNVTYIYDDSDVVGSESSLLATKYQSTSSYIQSGSTSTSTNTITSDEYDSFSVHTAQSFVVPLPVELMSFDGEVTDEGIVLKWTTASELNNDYFILERSVDGYSFFEVEVVSGHGTTNELIDYAVLDSDPIFGPSYYRLSQVDYDGTLSIFNPIQINNESLMKGISATLFPNPTQSYNVNLNFVSGDEVSPIQVAIYDMRGARVHYEILEPKVGNTQYHLKPTNELGTGVYQVVVIQNNNQEIQRVIIK